MGFQIGFTRVVGDKKLKEGKFDSTRNVRNDIRAQRWSWELVGKTGTSLRHLAAPVGADGALSRFSSGGR